MSKYRVEYEFKLNDYEVSDGKWHKDYLDNNGAGFEFDDAERVASELRAQSVCEVRCVEVINIETGTF